LHKGHGIVAGWDGICYRNTLANYSHIHAVGNADWADTMVRKARSYRRERSGGPVDGRLDPKRSALGTTKYSTAV
jgi:cobyrinic acid a,c-diamide synthase